MSAHRLITAGLIVLLAITLVAVSALAIHDTRPPPLPKMTSVPAPSPSREALLRCQQVAERTPECAEVWAESRRHFLSRSATSVQGGSSE